jgi:methionyl-tRNA formyltransferase
MRVIFMGTPDFAVPTLAALAAAGHEIVAVYSQPPRPARRGQNLHASPVNQAANALRIPVRTPVSLKGADEQAAFAALEADVAVVAAYGLILPQAVLDAPRLGCLNVHGSLLPRWRGAAPVQRAILAGDEDTGVCIMQMDRGLDTGPVRLCRKTWIGLDGAGRVTHRLSELGAEMMATVLSDPDRFPPVAQALDGVTYAHKIEKSEARLDFTLPAIALERKVRAFAPAPGAWFEFNDQRIKVLSARAIDRWPQYNPAPGSVIDRMDAQTSAARPSSMKHGEGIVIACGEGYLEPSLVQRSGRLQVPIAYALQGMPIPAGTILG